MMVKGNKVLFDGGKLKNSESGQVVASTHATNKGGLTWLAATLKKAEGKKVFSSTSNLTQAGLVWIKSQNALLFHGFPKY